MIRYWPLPSVTTVRAFSMSAGLAASTLTPGRMAPDESLTMPATAGWENAGVESRSNAAMTKDPKASARIDGSSQWSPLGRMPFFRGVAYGKRTRRSSTVINLDEDSRGRRSLPGASRRANAVHRLCQHRSLEGRRLSKKDDSDAILFPPEDVLSIGGRAPVEQRLPEVVLGNPVFDHACLCVSAHGHIAQARNVGEIVLHDQPPPFLNSRKRGCPSVRG